jgi:hypothetical protein
MNRIGFTFSPRIETSLSEGGRREIQFGRIRAMKDARYETCNFEGLTLPYAGPMGDWRPGFGVAAFILDGSRAAKSTYRQPA